MTHVADWKKEKVKNLKEKIENYNVVGVVDLRNLPSREMQQMRKNLRGDVEIFVTRKNLIDKAIEDVKDDSISKINKYLTGMVGLLFTNENPFKIMKVLNENKTNTYAKGGNIAPKDLMIRKGPTSFMPGPIISELAQFGLKTGVKDGKVEIKKDKVVVKEGEEISSDLASLLRRFDVKPMKIGLNLVAAYEDGTIFDKEILSVDQTKYIEDIKTAYRHGFNLSFNTNYPNSDVIEPMLIQSYRDAKGLSIEQNIFNSEVIEDILSKSISIAKALSSKTN
ncbi:MAG: 50S ribosomal protein L10 [Candidatus Woesearchaeota archaeon]